MPYTLFQGEEFEVLLKPQNNIKKLYLEITNDCNLQCTTCYRHAWEHKSGYMSLKTIKKIVAQLADFPHLEKIVLGGIGEPTYHPQFDSIFEKLNEKNIPLILTTNGTLLNKRLAEAVMESNVQEIIISIDSSNEERFKNIRNTALSPLLESQKYLADLKKPKNLLYPKLSWEFVAMKSNFTSLPKLIKLAAKIGITTVYVTHLMPVVARNTSEILYTNELRSSASKVFSEAQNIGHALGIKVIIPKNELKTDRFCRFVDNYATVISWDGEVCPCYRLLHVSREIVFGRQKELLQKSYGNIKSHTLSKIWQSAQYMKFRYEVKCGLYASCTDCDLVAGCDFPRTSEQDCMCFSPACSDCLWARGIIFCP